MDKEKFDPRNLAAMAFVGVALGVSWLGDQATFVRRPRSAMENLATLTHVLGYNLTRNRLYADGIAFSFYVVGLLIVLSFARKAIHRHIVFPKKIKKIMAELSLHRDLANQYNRNKLGESIL